MTRTVEKTRNGGKWTEARYWQFVRTALRMASRKWRPKWEAKERVRRPNESTNKRLKWEYQCADCLGWFRDDQTEVDHIVPCGNLQDDPKGFIERLFCEVDGFEVRCKSCHKNKTFS